MLSRTLYKFLLFLMIAFFLFIIIYQVIDSWSQKRTNEKYFAYNAFGFGKQAGEQDGFKWHSFGNYGVFNRMLFPCTKLIEGLKNNNSEDDGSESPTLQELALEINDLSNNLYNFASQLNMTGNNSANSIQSKLPSQPISITN